MSVIVRFPPINPFRFAEADKTVLDKYGYPSFGDALQIDALKPWQQKEQYYQKVATGDPVCIHYHRGRTGDNTDVHNPSELRIFEVGTNTLLKVVGISSSYTLSGITDDVTGEQLYTEQFFFIPSAIAELTGKKYIYFEFWWYFNVAEIVLKYRSNPILLKSSHPGTSLVEYNQLTNGHDILFEQLYPRFAYRIESNGMTYQPGGDYTVFEDQDRSTVTLDAEAFNVFKWDIGGFKGIPEYMVDIVNRSLQCCKDGYFRVDGREYVWQDGKLDNSGSEGKQVQWRSVQLRQKNEQDGYTFTKRKIKLFTGTGSYPFAINGLLISDNFTSISVLTNNQVSKVFDNTGALDTWVAAFNTNIAALGFASTITRETEDIYLNNAEGERFNLVLPVKIFPKCLTLNVAVIVANTAFNYNMAYPDTNRHQHVTCYGSTSGSEELYSNPIGNNSVVVSHNFATTGVKTVRIFHNDEERAFFTNRLPSLVGVTNISGVVSSKLDTFQVREGEFQSLTSVDLSFLAPAKNSLQTLSMEYCRMYGITAGWASSLTNAYTNLRYVYLDHNLFNSTYVDAFLNELVNSCALPYGNGTVWIQNQNTAAPPTAASLTARNKLTDPTGLNRVLATD